MQAVKAISHIGDTCNQPDTGKYRWHGSAEAYTGREVQDIPGVLAVFAERRKDSFGPYVRLMSVTLN